MWPGKLPNGESQAFYFPDDHPSFPGFFKGMKLILEERGLLNEAKNGWSAQSSNAETCQQQNAAVSAFYSINLIPCLRNHNSLNSLNPMDILHFSIQNSIAS